MPFLLLEPSLDASRESQLVEATAENVTQLPLKRNRVERRGLGGLDFGARAPLYEVSFDEVKRRKLVVPACEREHFIGDAEELREKSLQVRSEIEQQRRFGFRLERVRIRTRGSEPRGERRVSGTEELDEPAVDRGEPRAGVEVFEREAPGELEHGRRRSISAPGTGVSL